MREKGKTEKERFKRRWKEGIQVEVAAIGDRWIC